MYTFADPIWTMVQRPGKYAVRISGLGDGNHDFAFDLDGKFFSFFEQSEIGEGNVHAAVILEKKQGVMTLHFSLHGEVEVVCDRCLGSLLSRVDIVEKIFLETGDTPGEIRDNVIMIGRDEHEIDVAQFLYEFTILSLPIQRVHPSDRNGAAACDPEMIKKLDELGSEKNNRESVPDPRWSVLKNMIEKNS